VLTEGATFTVDGQAFTITYQGGADGKDVELTRNSGPAFVNRSFPQTALEGATVTLRGTITEPDTGDTFFLDIDWGDGQTETIEVPPGSSLDLAIDHRYLDHGRFKVKLLWRDQHGGSNDAEYVIRVRNVPPRLQNLNVTTPVAPGQVLTLTGSVADWIEGDDISIKVNWGNGATTIVIPNADGTFSIPYQYRKRGRYQITLTVKDERDRSDKIRLRVDVE
jgi:hypothetical protein